jgi:diguanylate cyclase (GGDEF)-like protein/PAS domain S-box-containing protein
MIVTTVIFFVMILLFNLDLYQTKRAEIDRKTKETHQSLHNIITTIENNIKSLLSNRLKTVSELDAFEKVTQDLFSHSTTHKQENFTKLNFHFEHIQKQLPGFTTLHIIDKDGYSYMRIHDKALHSDKIAAQRISLATALKSPKVRAYYEDGLYGINYRVSLPLFYKEQFVGLIEAGVNPTILLSKIDTLLGHKSYLLTKEKGSKDFTAESSIKPELAQLLWSSEDKITCEEKTYIRHEYPVYDFSKQLVLKVVTLEEITAIEENFKYSLLNSFAISLVLMLLLLALLERLLLKILKRIEELVYMLNKTDDYIFTVDANTRKIKFANAAFYNALKISKKELQGRDVDTLLHSRGEDKSSSSKLFYGKEEKTQSKEAMLMIDANTQIPLEVRVNYVNKENGYYIAICRDISEHLQQELERKVNEKMINKYIPLSQTDLAGNITYVNEAFCKLTGYTAQELIGQNHRMFRSSKTPKEFYKDLWSNITKNRSFSGELRILTKTKEEVWVRIVIEPRYDINGKKIGYVSTREDVTDKQELRFISERDQLTKIYNRRSFESKLSQAFEHTKKEHQLFGLVMFDIDHFKKVNDSYGHQVGDDILKAISKNIKEVIREEDFFARWGGEEFMLILKTSKIDELKLIVSKIQERIKTTDFSPVPAITLSFGLGIAKEEDTKESLLKRVDNALYKAKENGRNRYELAL